MDSDLARVNQVAAAHRQLEGAIRLHFANTDPVVVHSVAGNAANLTADLAKRLKGRTWDELSMQACGFEKEPYLNAMRGGVYFLKHAYEGPDKKVDTTAEFEFRASETEGLLFWAIQNVAIFDSISDVEGIFQLWFLATRVDVLGHDYKHMSEALSAFPDVARMSGENQRRAGARALEHVGLGG